MPTTSEDLRELATELFFVIPPPPGANTVRTDSYVLHCPDNALIPFTSVGRLRFKEEQREELIAEIRQHFANAGRPGLTWWISPDTTPDDLAERLRNEGVLPIEHPGVDAQLNAMVLDGDATIGEINERIVARQVGSAAEFARSSEIFWECEQTPDKERETFRPKLADYYEQRHLSGASTTYLAFLDGESIAQASASFQPGGAALNGACTLPAFRGKGAYRALVQARLADARAGGLGGLAVQARAMSEPILARVGFQSIGKVELLYDRLI